MNLHDYLSHHPAARLFILTLIGGAGALIIIVLAYSIVGRVMHTPQTVAQQERNTTTAHTPAATDITGTITEITDTTLTIQVQGLNTVTSETFYTVETNEETRYDLVDSRVPPIPGSGQNIQAITASRYDLALGTTASITLSTSTESVAQTITIIE